MYLAEHFKTDQIIGIEIWNGLCGERSLFELRNNKFEYFAALYEFLNNLRIKKAISRKEEEMQNYYLAQDFDEIVFCGGESSHPLLKERYSNIEKSYTVTFSSHGIFSAWLGAEAISKTLEWRNPWLIDLGQYQLKIASKNNSVSFLRDLKLLPYRQSVSSVCSDISSVQQFIKSSLADFEKKENSEPDGIVLGLPVAINDDGIASSCTYCGLSGDLGGMLNDLVKAPVVYLNDAVLAALGFPPEDNKKRLVVTLGHGVGAAICLGSF